MIFGMLILRKFDMKIWHICPPHLSDVSILLWKIQSHFQQYYSYIVLIIYVSQKKKTVIRLPPPPKNVTTLTCELQYLFTWLKVCCILSIAGGSEESQLCVVISGSEKNWLWCVATGMSGKQCHSKCSEWPRSALIHASSLFRHWSIAYYTTLCWNSAHVAISRYRKPQHVRINTRALPVACPRRSTRAMQITGSTKQQ